jgi:hypothetical protein
MHKKCLEDNMLASITKLLRIIITHVLTKARKSLFMACSQQDQSPIWKHIGYKNMCNVKRGIYEIA